MLNVTHPIGWARAEIWNLYSYTFLEKNFMARGITTQWWSICKTYHTRSPLDADFRKSIQEQVLAATVFVLLPPLWWYYTIQLILDFCNIKRSRISLEIKLTSVNHIQKASYYFLNEILFCEDRTSNRLKQEINHVKELGQAPDHLSSPLRLWDSWITLH